MKKIIELIVHFQLIGCAFHSGLVGNGLAIALV